MRWPGNIAAGQVSSEPISALDLLPGFCQLAGAAIPDNLQLDGASFVPALEGKSIKRQKPLIWAYYNALNEHRVAMRDGKWKVLAKLDLEQKISKPARPEYCGCQASQVRRF